MKASRALKNLHEHAKFNQYWNGNVGYYYPLSVYKDWLTAGKTVDRAINRNFLEISVSGPTFFVIFLLYGYVEGHIWPLMIFHSSNNASKKSLFISQLTNFLHHTCILVQVKSKLFVCVLSNLRMYAPHQARTQDFSQMVGMRFDLYYPAVNSSPPPTPSTSLSNNRPSKRKS